MKQFELRSVVNSTSGGALNVVSVIVLVAGIISFVIYAANAAIEMDLSIFIHGAEVLIGSIFFCIFGRAAAKLVNYVEAIYKNVNPDSDKDVPLANNSTFFPGDEVCLKEDPSIKLIVRNVYIDSYGYNKYICVKPNGEEVDVYISALETPEGNK